MIDEVVEKRVTSQIKKSGTVLVVISGNTEYPNGDKHSFCVPLVVEHPDDINVFIQEITEAVVEHGGKIVEYPPVMVTVVDIKMIAAVSQSGLSRALDVIKDARHLVNWLVALKPKNSPEWMKKTEELRDQVRKGTHFFLREE